MPQNSWQLNSKEVLDFLQCSSPSLLLSKRIVYSICSIDESIELMASYFFKVNGPSHSLRTSEGSTIATANRGSINSVIIPGIHLGVSQIFQVTRH